MKKKIPKEVSDYMRKIGAKGNKNRTSEFYKKMVKARWDKKLSTGTN